MGNENCYGVEGLVEENCGKLGASMDTEDGHNWKVVVEEGMDNTLTVLMYEEVGRDKGRDVTAVVVVVVGMHNLVEEGNRRNCYMDMKMKNRVHD